MIFKKRCCGAGSTFRFDFSIVRRFVGHARAWNKMQYWTFWAVFTFSSLFFNLLGFFCGAENLFLVTTFEIVGLFIRLRWNHQYCSYKILYKSVQKTSSTPTICGTYLKCVHIAAQNLQILGITHLNTEILLCLRSQNDTFQDFWIFTCCTCAIRILALDRLHHFVCNCWYFRHKFWFTLKNRRIQDYWHS